MVIFSHIEHILHNHFATFHCGLGFLKFMTFSWWSLCKYEASLANGILGLIIKVMKGGSYLIKLIKLFLIIDILDSNDSSFSRYNHLKSLTYILDTNEIVLVLYNTLDCINRVATEKRNLVTVKVKLLDLLYLTIVHVFCLAP
jgi:hypothetical protein